MYSMSLPRIARTSAFCFPPVRMRQSTCSTKIRNRSTIQQYQSFVSITSRRSIGSNGGKNTWGLSDSSFALASSRDVHTITDDPSALLIPAGTTVQEAYNLGVDVLHKANVTEPEASMPQLLASALDLDWETGYRNVMRSPLQQQTLDQTQAETLNQYLNRRLNHEPIQYILGQWDFLDYVVSIRPPLLCPRPETEELVQLVLQDIQQNEKEHVKILDIGCGTGVIGISLADKLKDATVQAIDIEPIAVETSQENAKRILQGADNLDRYQCHLMPVAEYDLNAQEQPFDMIVSNPPYIPTDDYKGLSPDIVNFESRDALEAGDDGLAVIREILQSMKRLCKPGAPCWMEVDPTHPTLLEELLSSEKETGEWGVVFVSSHKDMFGKDRFVKLQYTGDNDNTNNDS